MFLKVEDRWINPAAVLSITPDRSTGGALLTFINGVVWSTEKHSADGIVGMMLDMHLEQHERGKRRQMAG